MTKPHPKSQRPAAAAPRRTPDLCDAHESLIADGRLRVFPPVLQNYGGAEQMSGPVVTVKCFEDNGLIRQTLSQPGNGRVLVVDGGGSDRCALVGGDLAGLAERQGWAGLVIHGCVRDLSELIEAQVGVWAIANHPRKPATAGLGAKDIPVDVAGVLVRPGEYLVADADGVLVSEKIL
ncbi:MAG: hypothetical protein RLY30_1961 [Pseudomonadota bacterium]|jgi:regulator of ribonuclease activity A